LLNDKKAENIMENLFKNIPISIADIEPNTLLNIQKLKFKNILY
jgi:hypothetical protein